MGQHLFYIWNIALFQVKRDSDNLKVVLADKRDDLVALGRLVNVSLNALQGIEDGSP